MVYDLIKDPRMLVAMRTNLNGSLGSLKNVLHSSTLTS